uniref:Uncharacterized protein n=1 Tax=Quercus lobata TaxID=97700 RepID=A0A7N2MHM7_QUELO
MDQVLFDGLNCIYPSSPATALGIVALLAIILSQIIITVATGCICCCKRGSLPTTSNWTAAQACFSFSWFSVVIAAILLVLGSAYNNSQQTTIQGDNYFQCYVVKPGIFAGGAIMSLASVVCGLFAYILTQGKDSPTGQPQFQAGSPNQGGIAMGQPQPQYQWGNQGGVPAGPIKFPPQGPQEHV